MSLNLCEYCVILAKLSSAYRTGYACGNFARMPCLRKDLGQIPSNPTAKSGFKQKGVIWEPY